MPPYRSGEPDLDAVLLPLLARSEPGRERPLDLERARTRLLSGSKPSDGVHLLALLSPEALDLGSPPTLPRSSVLRSQEEHAAQARLDHARTNCLDYLGLLFAAACLHDQVHHRLAEILRGHHPAILKERLVLQLLNASRPLAPVILEALQEILRSAPPAPSAEERNLISSAARAIQVHLGTLALDSLRPYLVQEALLAPGGELRAQMILTDLDPERLDASWRPVLGNLLQHTALASFACDLLAGLPPDPQDSERAAAALEAHLDRGEPPDGYLIWLIARAPHPGAASVLLRCLDAEIDPDWQTILEGLERLGDPGTAEPLLHWVARHRKRTGRPGSWDGYDAARRLARRLASRTAPG
ncbi:MAG: hypothetical protein RMJ98_09680 [Myxococcales bacterium]|nr:hypothetical protein [Polyangiaceae bacterium]MDW8249558.1 hypothetical protein [Myxococcales bacterium]